MYKITVPAIELKVGMTLADPVNITNQRGETIITLPPNYKITDKAIMALKTMKNYESYTVSIFSKTPQVLNELAPPLPGSLVVEQDFSMFPGPKTLINEETRDEAISGIRALFTGAVAGSSKDLKKGDNMTTAYQIVTNLDGIMDELVETVTANPKGLIHISGLRSYDEYTYHHSLSVTVLSLAIGQSVGLNPKEIKRLGRAAMMHDIGKMMIPKELIGKPSALTPLEFSQVKKHPELGAKYLKSEFVGNQELWDAMMYHHEKEDGTGYPRGLKGKDIPVFSKIIAVADVYDALTSFRSYRDPMRPPANAIELIMSEAETAFDLSIVQAFIKRIELYPVDTIVHLSDKRVGVVVANRNPMRPTLKIIDTGEMVDLAAFESLHLVITWVEQI